MSTSLGVVFLAGRILFVIFLVPLSGVGHIRRGTMMIGYAKSTGMPLPSLAGWPSGVWLIAGGVSVAAGLWANLGALMLSLFVTLAALQFHRFWAIEDETQRSTQKQSFWRDNATQHGQLGARNTIVDVRKRYCAHASHGAPMNGEGLQNR